MAFPVPSQIGVWDAFLIIGLSSTQVGHQHNDKHFAFWLNRRAPRSQDES
jgi:hypothetical protein